MERLVYICGTHNFRLQTIWNIFGMHQPRKETSILQIPQGYSIWICQRKNQLTIFTCLVTIFFNSPWRGIISIYVLYLTVEFEPQEEPGWYKNLGRFVVLCDDYLMHLCHLPSLCENTVRKCVNAVNCSQLFYSPFSMLVPSLGIDIIMHLSKTDCHFRASIMCKIWQHILPLGFAYILCMLLYCSGIQ